MKPNDIRKLNGAELQKKRAELTQELFNLKFQMNTGRLENTAKLGQIRRDTIQLGGHNRIIAGCLYRSLGGCLGGSDFVVMDIGREPVNRRTVKL